VIDIIPAMPKQRTKDAPRIAFTGSQYKKLITTARKIAAAGETKVRGVLIEPQHVQMWEFLIHSFLRPSVSELFALRHCDVVERGELGNAEDPLHLELKINGKTGPRFVATMPRAYSTANWRRLDHVGGACALVAILFRSDLKLSSCDFIVAAYSCRIVSSSVFSFSLGRVGLPVFMENFSFETPALASVRVLGS